MLFFYVLNLIAAATFSLARLGNRQRGSDPQLVQHGMFPDRVMKHSSRHVRRASVDRRQVANSTSCGSGSQLSANAPRRNIFAGLTNDEAAAVTSFLHDQKSLNVTAAANATR